MPTVEPRIAMRDSILSDLYAREQYQDSEILVSTISRNEQVSAQWNSVIDERLIEWGQHPNEFELEGLVAPSSDAICKAYKLFAFMRERDWPLPTGVIADGEGGIVFENRRDPVYQRVEISPEGLMQLVTYYDRRMTGQPALIDID